MVSGIFPLRRITTTAIAALTTSGVPPFVRAAGPLRTPFAFG